MKLSDLAARLGGEVKGDGGVDLRRVAGLDEAGPGDLSFVASAKYLARIARTRASALIVAPGVDAPVPRLVVANPYLAFARAVALLHPQARPSPGVHPTAQVDPSARLGQDAHVGAYAVIGARARVGARSVIHPHVVLYEDVELGDDCVVHSGAQVREGCRLGRRVIVQNGAVIGADGFGFARDEAGRYEKIPQVGGVVIEDDVEVGALTAVDRAALHETRIGRGSKLDNLVQIGHSAAIGADTVLAAQVGIAGSTRVGSRVTLAGQVGVAGHVTIGDGATVTGQTGIASDVADGALVSGYPAIPSRDWRKASAVFAKLPELQRRLRRLEAEVESLKARQAAGGDAPRG